MGYNKTVAEKEWREEWEKKEKALRDNGCSENLIKELRDFEWFQFNRDRKFYEHLKDYKKTIT